MASRQVNALTRDQIVATAQAFRWDKKMPKWTVLVEGRELPVRPLVLAAAGVRPNDSTNSHMAVSILESLGFENPLQRSEPVRPGRPPGRHARHHGDGDPRCLRRPPPLSPAAINQAASPSPWRSSISTR